MLISGGYYAATSVYLVEFAMLGCLLSLAFLASPVRSPNYYYVVNRRVWLLNWSKPAKVVNSGTFSIAMLLGVPEVVAVVWALILLLLKVYSMRIVLAMGFKRSSSIHYVG